MHTSDWPKAAPGRAMHTSLAHSGLGANALQPAVMTGVSVSTIAALIDGKEVIDRRVGHISIAYRRILAACRIDCDRAVAEERVALVRASEDWDPAEPRRHNGQSSHLQPICMAGAHSVIALAEVAGQRDHIDGRSGMWRFGADISSLEKQRTPAHVHLDVWSPHLGRLDEEVQPVREFLSLRLCSQFASTFLVATRNASEEECKTTPTYVAVAVVDQHNIKRCSSSSRLHNTQRRLTLTLTPLPM